MDLHTLSANIQRIRVAKGKSQGDVADAAGLSRQGYRNIETGEAEPRVDTLSRIADALGVRLEELLMPVRTLSHVRFRAQKKMTTRGELLADVARWLDDYNELEVVLDAKQTFDFEKVRAQIREARRGAARAKKAAALAREAVNVGERETIRDICGLLEHHGVKVFAPQLASEGFFGLSVSEQDGGPAVVVNTWDRLSVERWIFTAAHELGHLLMHLDAYDVAESKEDDGQEKEADLFAAEFLMPEVLFEQELKDAVGLPLVRLVFKLKSIFRVSWKTVLYRLSQRSPEDGKLWARFHTEYRALRGRGLSAKEEPEALVPGDFHAIRPSSRVADEPEHLLQGAFVEDRLHRLVRTAVEHEEISLGRGAEILRMDLREMRALANSWISVK